MSSSWSWWNIWLFSGRINRLRLLIVILACLFYVILIESSGIAQGNNNLAFIIPLPVIYLSLTTSVQRLHDLGYTGWFVLLYFVLLYLVLYVTLRLMGEGYTIWFILLYLIPGLNTILIILLLCLKGNSGENQYGPDPLP